LCSGGKPIHIHEPHHQPKRRSGGKPISVLEPHHQPKDRFESRPNVLNYFITFGERGAEDQEEFDRQKQKLVTALSGVDADIFGLHELENNFPAVLVDLVSALNARVGS
jgi:hypothetical protein